MPASRTPWPLRSPGRPGDERHRPGHKDKTRDDAPANIADTRRYLDEAAWLLEAEPARQGFFAQMLQRYPKRVNPYTVWLTAAAC
jgi:hypothetical protein